MKKQPPRFLILLAPLLAFTPSAVAAAAAETVAPSAAAIVGANMASRPSATSLELDFPGGTIAQLVATMSTAAHSTFNLIGEKAHQEIHVPPMTLHGFEPASLSFALSNFLRPQGLSLSLSPGNIFVLTKATGYTGPQSPAPNFQAFQLAPYLATLSPEAITDAVKTAWESDPTAGAKTVTFKFHPETKLLFVYGPPEAIALASVVIPQLNPVASARVRADSFTYAPIPYPTPADETARLNQVSAEVRRRREAREAAKTDSSKPSPAAE